MRRDPKRSFQYKIVGLIIEECTMVWKDRRTVKQLGRSGKDYKNRLSIRRKKNSQAKKS